VGVFTNSCNISIRKPEFKKPFWRRRHTFKGVIEADIQEIVL
jgi:hypothetical protein